MAPLHVCAGTTHSFVGQPFVRWTDHPKGALLCPLVPTDGTGCDITGLHKSCLVFSDGDIILVLRHVRQDCDLLHHSIRSIRHGLALGQRRDHPHFDRVDSLMQANVEDQVSSPNGVAASNAAGFVLQHSVDHDEQLVLSLLLLQVRRDASNDLRLPLGWTEVDREALLQKLRVRGHSELESLVGVDGIQGRSNTQVGEKRVLDTCDCKNMLVMHTAWLVWQ